jgi:uncharacterized SAM-dependent methyltransferase
MTEPGGGGVERPGALADPYDREAMLAEVLAGLRRPDRRLPSKYHYDEVGSELFERITQLDEYYLTRNERALLQRWMPVWLDDLRPRGLVELGPGSADKSRILLDAMVSQELDALYVPVDVSGDFLYAVADKLRAEYPGLQTVTIAVNTPMKIIRTHWERDRIGCLSGRGSFSISPGGALSKPNAIATGTVTKKFTNSTSAGVKGTPPSTRKKAASK